MHHATGSKRLVNLLHVAGCRISYNDVALKLHLPNQQCQPFKSMVIYLVPGRFLQFSYDNIDILEHTVDGRNTFHATLIVAFQRDPNATSFENEIILDATSKKATIKHVPTDFKSNSFSCNDS